VVVWALSEANVNGRIDTSSGSFSEVFLFTSSAKREEEGQLVSRLHFLLEVSLTVSNCLLWSFQPTTYW
jgi:hypothetical protein